MNLNETFDLMRAIRKAQHNPKTCVGACYSLQEHLGRKGLAAIGALDGKPAIYATAPQGVPSQWNGFPVVDTGEKSRAA